ncbi:MAG: condensation domain-containing protein [Pseudomonadota bacterium]|nr:condensation domain-containing protein [Pseudomonadota bacterium]
MEFRMLQLTSTQRDIYLEGKFFGGVVNNIGGYRKYSCELDVPRFIRARELLLQGNDAYHLRFDDSKGGCVAVVDDRVPRALQLLDFSAEADAGSTALAWIQQQFAPPLANIAESVFQDALIKVSEREYWYFAKAHHLIMDGWGFALQMQRYLPLYEQLAFGGPASSAGPSFVAYMQDQSGYPASKQYAASRDYWLAQYDTLPGNLMPTKAPVSTRSATSSRVSATIDAALIRSLNDLARSAGASIVTVFYAALYVYFPRWCTTPWRDCSSISSRCAHP